MTQRCGVRVFLPVTPPNLAQTTDALLLLWALLDRLPTRAINIGYPQVAGTAWNERPDVWSAPAPHPYVNVVMAPLGMMLGTTLTQSSLRGTAAWLSPQLGDVQMRDEVVYEAQTAFATLWTARVCNVAVVLPSSDQPTPDMLAPLARYDRAFALDAPVPGLSRLEAANVALVAHTIVAMCEAIDAGFSDH